MLYSLTSELPQLPTPPYIPFEDDVNPIKQTSHMHTVHQNLHYRLVGCFEDLRCFSEI